MLWKSFQSSLQSHEREPNMSMSSNYVPDATSLWRFTVPILVVLFSILVRPYPIRVSLGANEIEESFHRINPTRTKSREKNCCANGHTELTAFFISWHFFNGKKVCWLQNRIDALKHIKGICLIASSIVSTKPNSIRVALSTMLKGLAFFSLSISTQTQPREKKSVRSWEEKELSVHIHTHMRPN